MAQRQRQPDIITRCLSGLAVLAVVLLSSRAVQVVGSVRIRNLNNIVLGTWSGSGDENGNDNVCAYINPLQNYKITVTGSGAGGAYDLANGGATIPFEVYWNTVASPGGTQLTAGVALDGLGNGSTSSTCASGDNANVSVIVREANMASAAPGAYSGTIWITIEPGT